MPKPEGNGRLRCGPVAVMRGLHPQTRYAPWPSLSSQARGCQAVLLHSKRLRHCACGFASGPLSPDDHAEVLKRKCWRPRALVSFQPPLSCLTVDVPSSPCHLNDVLIVQVQPCKSHRTKLSECRGILQSNISDVSQIGVPWFTRIVTSRIRLNRKVTQLLPMPLGYLDRSTLAPTRH